MYYVFTMNLIIKRSRNVGDEQAQISDRTSSIVYASPYNLVQTTNKNIISATSSLSIRTYPFKEGSDSQLLSSDCKIVHGRTVWQHSVSYTLTLTSNMAFVTKKDATLSKTASSGLSLDKILLRGINLVGIRLAPG